MLGSGKPSHNQATPHSLRQVFGTFNSTSLSYYPLLLRTLLLGSLQYSPLVEGVSSSRSTLPILRDSFRGRVPRPGLGQSGGNMDG